MNLLILRNIFEIHYYWLAWFFLCAVAVVLNTNFVTIFNLVLQIIFYLFARLYLIKDKRKYTDIKILILLITGLIFSYTGLFRQKTNRSILFGNFTIIKKYNHKPMVQIKFNQIFKRILINVYVTQSSPVNQMQIGNKFRGKVNIISKNYETQGHYYGKILYISHIYKKSKISKLKLNLKKRILSKFPLSGGLIIGILTGDKEFLEKNNEYLIYALGLGHMLAVSGIHMVFFSSFVFIFSRFLLFFLPVYMKFTIAYLLQFITILFIMFFADFSPSSIRSFLMSSISIISTIACIKRNVFFVWALCFIGMLIYNPYWSNNISFLMSFFAVLGLFLSRKARYKNRMLAFFKESLYIQGFLHVLSIEFFHHLNLSSILWNILIVNPLCILVLLSLFGLIIPINSILDAFSYFILKLLSSCLEFFVVDIKFFKANTFIIQIFLSLLIFMGHSKYFLIASNILTILLIIIKEYYVGRISFF